LKLRPLTEGDWDLSRKASETLLGTETLMMNGHLEELKVKYCGEDNKQMLPEELNATAYNLKSLLDISSIEMALELLFTTVS
jgi:hypothetical protein